MSGYRRLADVATRIARAVLSCGGRLIGRQKVSRSGSRYQHFADRHGCRFVVRVSDHFLPWPWVWPGRKAFNVVIGAGSTLDELCRWMTRSRRPATSGTDHASGVPVFQRSGAKPGGASGDGVDGRESSRRQGQAEPSILNNRI